jgi:hypothetical protein
MMMMVVVVVVGLDIVSEVTAASPTMRQTAAVHYYLGSLRAMMWCISLREEEEGKSEEQHTRSRITSMDTAGVVNQLERSMFHYK